MINIILSFLAGLAGAMLGCYLWSKRKWRLVVTDNPKTHEKILELVQDQPGRVEFLADVGAEELSELSRPAWSKFLSQFKIKR